MNATPIPFPVSWWPKPGSARGRGWWLWLLLGLVGVMVSGVSSAAPPGPAAAPTAAPATVPAGAAMPAPGAVAKGAGKKGGRGVPVPELPVPETPPPPDPVELLRQELNGKLDEQGKASAALKQELEALQQQMRANTKSIDDIQKLRQEVDGKFDEQGKRIAAVQTDIDGLGQEVRTHTKSLAELKDKLEQNAILVYEHLARGMARGEAFEQMQGRLEQIEARLGIRVSKRPAGSGAAAAPGAPPNAMTPEAKPGAGSAPGPAKAPEPPEAKQGGGASTGEGSYQGAGLQVAGYSAGQLVALPLLLVVALGLSLVEMSWLESWAAPQAGLRNLLVAAVVILGFFAVGHPLMFGPMELGADAKDIDIDVDAVESFRLYHLGLVLVGALLVTAILSDRLSLPAYAFLALIFGSLAYPLLGHWAWSGQWHGLVSGALEGRGFIDFAGGTVVHSFAAWFTLGWLWRFPVVRLYHPESAAADSRRGREPALVLLGAFLLWLGWFGAVVGNPEHGGLPAATQMLNIALSGAAALFTVLVSLLVRPRELDAGSIFGRIAAGIVAGLVIVAAGANRFEPGEALCLGVLAGLLQPLVFRGLTAKLLARDEAAAELIAAHGGAGVLGTLAVGLFGTSGLFTLPDFGLLGIQFLGVIVALVLGLAAGVLSVLLWQLLGKLKTLQAAVTAIAGGNR